MKNRYLLRGKGKPFPTLELWCWIFSAIDIFHCYCTITPFPLKILWVYFPVLPKVADKSHKPITKGFGCCWSEAFKNGTILLILFL